MFFEKFAILRNGIREESTLNRPNYGRDTRLGDCSLTHYHCDRNQRNWQFFGPCDLEIWQMTLKNNTESPPFSSKLVSFDSHPWIQIRVIVQMLKSEPNWPFFSPRDLKVWQMSSKNNRRPLQCPCKFCATFRSCLLIQLGSYSSKTLNSSKNHQYFCLCDLKIWWMTLKNNREPLLCYFKLCVSFHCHPWIKAGVTVRKHSIWVKIVDFFWPCDLEIWQITLKNDKASLQYHFKLCASFRNHLWIQTGVTVWKLPKWVKICFNLCDLDLWLWPFAWTLLPSKRQRDREINGQMEGQTELSLELLGHS